MRTTENANASRTNANANRGTYKRQGANVNNKNANVNDKKNRKDTKQRGGDMPLAFESATARLTMHGMVRLSN